LFGILAATRFQRLAARRADLVRFGQVNELLTHGQVAVIAASGSGLTGLSPARTLGRGVGRVVKFIGAIAPGLLLGAATKPFGLQLADLATELFVFLFQGRHTLHGIGVAAPPIAGLLPQFQILTPQSGYFGAQLIHFCQEPRNQRRQICACGLRFQRYEQNAIHDSCVVLSGRPKGKDRS
jgi:hypothetical protein